VSHVLLAPGFAGSIWKRAGGVDSFAKISKEAVATFSPPLYFKLHQYRTQFDFDENDHGEANEQLNTYPLYGVSKAALFMNNPG